MQTLTLLPLRQDGVRGTLEFIFSVHPSGESQAGMTAPQKHGAAITPEAVGVATRLLSTVPASMTAQAWFDGISGQLFHLMDGSEGPELARTAAQIVGLGILGRKQVGAPGKSNAFLMFKTWRGQALTSSRCSWMGRVRSAIAERRESLFEDQVRAFHRRRR